VFVAVVTILVGKSTPNQLVGSRSPLDSFNPPFSLSRELAAGVLLLQLAV
jgi:hypothetical protein